MSQPTGTHAFREQLEAHFRYLYPERNAEDNADQAMAIFGECHPPRALPEGWTEADSVLITYGDSLLEGDCRPLDTLDKFLTTYVQDAISTVHVLPFFPFSSDDGFAVIDYQAVNPQLGDWSHLLKLSERYRLMGDLVINHASSEIAWFQQFLANEKPGRDYFIEVDPETDLSAVVRPRTSPLLRAVPTADGLKHVWCTFSHDQVDLNFKNPEVLFEFLRIIVRYLNEGISVLRLDAIGFLWKEIGTSCIHRPETHEVVRLIRTVTEHYAPGTILITETNVPNHENLTYFGNRNEAHMIYNFSLAPLLLDALLRGRANHLKSWMMSMPPAPMGCAYLNFTASHDGIGMRPAEGLLDNEQQRQMIDVVKRHGGEISSRRMPDGAERVYELNISLFDALRGPANQSAEIGMQRFLCSQTIMLALEGVPAIYIHSLLATRNDYQRVKDTGHPRAINRHQWDYAELCRRLEEKNSLQRTALDEILRRLRIRTAQPAFHPNATQFTLQLKPWFFGFWRQSRDHTQSLFAIHNLSVKNRPLALSELNLFSTQGWYDLISGTQYTDNREEIVLLPYQCLWITNAPHQT